MSFINQHSFLLAGAMALALLGLALFRDGVKPTDWIALGALGLGLGIAFWLLRPGPSTLNQARAVRARIGAGKPVLLMFQSNY
jgi:hypothetical protein